MGVLRRLISGRPKVVFHLGDYKTGSSSIQKVLKNSQFTSDDLEVFYPTRIPHDDLAKAFFAAPSQEALQDRFGLILEEIQASKARLSVVSSEQFQDVPPQAMAAVLDAHFPKKKFDVSLVAYVRPHAPRVVSAYMERVKVGTYKGTLDEFSEAMIGRKRFFYKERMDKWRAQFGDAYQVRLFNRASLFQACVVHDFIRGLNERANFEITHEVQTNQSLTLQDAALLREINGYFDTRDIGVDARREICRCLGRYLNVLKHSAPQKVKMHKALAQRTYDVYLNDARAMDEAYFGGNTMVAELERALENCDLDEPQNFDFEQHYQGDARRIINAFLGVFVDMAQADEKVFEQLVTKGGQIFDAEH